MAQNVKINASYSEKTTENYNSVSYGVALELEAPINGTTQDVEIQTARLFMLCKKIVAGQKGTNIDNLLTSQPTQSTPAATILLPQPPTPVAPPVPSNGNGHASDRQIRYLLTLARKAGMRDLEIRAMPNDRFGKPNFDTLSSHEASTLIDEFNQRKAA
jgi:hypothetical protein